MWSAAAVEIDVDAAPRLPISMDVLSRLTRRLIRLAREKPAN
jgi:hypothetical protein